MLKAKNKWVKGKALACQCVVMREITKTNKCFIKELRGKMAQVITEEQKTLMIWLAIDCACYCLQVFGSHPQGSRTGKLNDSLGMCLYFWRVVLLCLQRTFKLLFFSIPGDLHDCCWFTKLYFIFCGQFMYWLYDQIYKLKELVGRPNVISNQNNHLH